MRLRFAPSPTGYIHLANARIALLNYIYALKHNAEFVLRIDDTDIERSKTEYTEQIIKDVKWLGIEYESIFKQSERYDIYNNIIELLKAKNIIYPAYETSLELEKMREKQLALKQAPRYKQMINEEQAKAEGRKPHWRFRLSDNQIEWEDDVMGKLSFLSKQSSDPVIMREDGSVPYILASIIDDYMMNISHVVRGRDHISNTAIQIDMFERLNELFNTNKTITFGHFPLISDLDGNVFSKREGSYALKTFKEDGINPGIIAAFLLQLGLSENLFDFLSADSTLKDISQHIDWSKYGKSDLKCDTKQIANLNAKYIISLDHIRGKQWCESYNISIQKDLPFDLIWPIIKFDIKDIKDCKQLLDIFSSIHNQTCLINHKNNINTLMIKQSDLRKVLEYMIEIFTKDKTIDNLMKKINEKMPDFKMQEIGQMIRLLCLGRMQGPKVYDFLKVFDLTTWINYLSSMI